MQPTSGRSRSRLPFLAYLDIPFEVGYSISPVTSQFGVPPRAAAPAAPVSASRVRMADGEHPPQAEFPQPLFLAGNIKHVPRG